MRSTPSPAQSLAAVRDIARELNASALLAKLSKSHDLSTAEYTPLQGDVANKSCADHARHSLEAVEVASVVRHLKGVQSRTYDLPRSRPFSRADLDRLAPCRVRISRLGTPVAIRRGGSAGCDP